MVKDRISKSSAACSRAAWQNGKDPFTQIGTWPLLFGGLGMGWNKNGNALNWGPSAF